MADDNMPEQSPQGSGAQRTITIIVLILAVAAVIYYMNDNTKKETPTEATTMQSITSQPSEPKITPISHATMVLGWAGKVIYTDPTDAKLMQGQPDADVILVTDIHGDHFSTATLESMVKEKTMLISPKAVADLLPDDLKDKNTIIANGETKDIAGFKITAVPMYNIPESDKAFHTKGRGNGYVIEANSKRVYVSGDTSATPEMKALQNIDIAFVCMNLPYTMSVEEATQGVLAFKPKEVIPYHYKGSDTQKFKELVNAGDPNINVNLLNFYPNQ